MNSGMNTDVIQKRLIPRHMREAFPEVRVEIFQQVLSPCRILKQVHEFFNKYNVSILEA